MEKRMPFRLMAFFALITLLFAIFSCDDDESNDLSGRWNFIEPPHPQSRINRGQDPTPAFDVVFTIEGREITELDLIVHGQFIDGETAQFDSDDLIIEGGGLSMRIKALRRAANTLQTSGVDATLNNEPKSFGALQIDKY